MLKAALIAHQMPGSTWIELDQFALRTIKSGELVKEQTWSHHIKEGTHLFQSIGSSDAHQNRERSIDVDGEPAAIAIKEYQSVPQTPLLLTDFP